MGALLLALAASACGTAQLRVAAMDDVERVRAGADAQEGAKEAPEAYARAEQERRISIAAHEAGDDLAAEIHAQRALAAYTHALVVGRLARAATEQADAQKALDDTNAQAQTVEASRAQLEQQVQDLEQRLRVARDRLVPAASASAPADREAARQTAARSMAVEARLLCDAAQLATADTATVSGLADALADVGKLEDRLARGASAPPPSTTPRARAPVASTRSPGPGARPATTRARPTRCSPSCRPAAAGRPRATSAASS